jgi:hypothetical protein
MFVEVIEAMNQAGVDYVVVGGVATVLHGHPRTTGDIHLVISLEPANTSLALEKLASLGYSPAVPVEAADFNDEDKRRDWIETKGMLVLPFRSANRSLAEVDLFARHPIPYEELSAGATVVDVGSTRVRVCSLDHLIQMKTGTGRSRDEEDVKRLTAIKAKRDRHAE